MYKIIFFFSEKILNDLFFIWPYYDSRTGAIHKGLDGERVPK